MMKIFYLTLLLGISTLSFGQCPNSDIHLRTQSDIDNFSTNYPGCNQLLHDLYITEISSGAISNLNGLSAITKVADLVYIFRIQNLGSLSGLDNLTEVEGRFIIREVGGITNFTGLSSLTSIGQTIQIEYNPNLVDFTGISALTSVGAFSVIGNNVLQDFSGINNLQTVGGYNIEQFWIFDNPQLTSLTGLEGLTTINGVFNLTNNDALLSLSGLTSLTSIGKQIHISDNAILNSVSGLNNLNDIGNNGHNSSPISIYITSNPQLTSLGALLNLTTIDGSIILKNLDLTSLSGLDNIDHSGISALDVNNNSNLSTCHLQNICDFLDGGGVGSFSLNTVGCNSKMEVETACAALPVELTHFKGKKSNENILLQWQTASELNNSHFEIERSYDGKTFEVISDVLGKGTTVEMNDYQFIDESPFSGENFYRLKQVDFDGDFEYSYVISVQTESKELSLFPNPTTGVLNIRGNDSERTEILVFDSIGKLKKRGFGNEIDISELPFGHYSIQFKSGNYSFFKRIVKH